jgi:uncharacterized protein (UPF0303 family)
MAELWQARENYRTHAESCNVALKALLSRAQEAKAAVAAKEAAAAGGGAPVETKGKAKGKKK